MIGRLRGTVLETSGNLVTIDVGGVGYEVLVPDSVLVHVGREGVSADLRIRQVFREDGVTLYGFAEPGQRRLFDLLMEVKGCGPKIGLALLGQLGEETVTAAIAGQDARQLARASGVGPRLAERIILELKDKISEEVLLSRAAASVARPVAASDEVVEALMALGYRRTEAESAADSAGSEGSVEERIRAALRVLGKK
jgi:Holliday junction DNA helicase RuvA